ncbi:MAG: hypothetical protein E6I88_04095 [Chloroflexi bacterium]|nr:MAG: hypothetical protein E6I88_04095 [Chloroflexota bacterium]
MPSRRRNIFRISKPRVSVNELQLWDVVAVVNRTLRQAHLPQEATAFSHAAFRAQSLAQVRRLATRYVTLTR